MKLIACYFITKGNYTIKHDGVVHYGNNTNYGLRLLVKDYEVLDSLTRIKESIATTDNGTAAFIRMSFKQAKTEYQRTHSVSQSIDGIYHGSYICVQDISEEEANELAPHTQEYVNKYMKILDMLCAKTDMTKSIVHFCAVSKIPESTLNKILQTLI